MKSRLRKRVTGWDGSLKKAPKGYIGPERKIWCRIPVDLQLRILRFLPPVSLFRFRWVSRSWRSEIASIPAPIGPGVDSFLISIGPRPGFYPDQQCVHVADRTKLWKKILYLCDGKMQKVFREQLDCLSNSGGLVLAAHGAFHHEATKGFAVFNPFVPGSDRMLELLHLPLSPCFINKLAFVGFQTFPVGPNLLRFVVVCVSAHGLQPPLVHVFDSRRWRWVVRDAPLPGFKVLEDWEMGDERIYMGDSNNFFVLWNDDLYFLTITRDNTRSRLKSVNIWDLENTCKTLSSWTDLPLNLHDPDDISLIRCQEKLVIVNVVPCSTKGEIGDIGFLQFDREIGRWEVLMKFSMKLFKAREKKKIEQLENVAEIGLSATGSTQHSKVALFFKALEWGCIVDVSNPTWYRSSCITTDFQMFQPTLFSF